MHARLTKDNLLVQPLRILGSRLDHFDEINSTNEYLLARAPTLPDGALAVAEAQTAGRGRLGRRWHAPRGSSILLSALLKEPAVSRVANLATILAAVATCHAVEQTTACRPEVRWPNDLVSSGRKLAGVLVESCALEPENGRILRGVVIGIGLNCLQQRGHFADELTGAATSLDLETPHAIQRSAVATALLSALDAQITALRLNPAHGEFLRAEWKSRCADLGHRVTLQHDRRTYTGTVLDVDDSGDLLIQLDEGPRRYFASATTTRIRQAAPANGAGA